eukprot:1626079-Alexandrium_andersonii.AAC.1
MSASLVGSEMCIRDRSSAAEQQRPPPNPDLPCPFGSRCDRLDRSKFPNGCGYKRDPSEYYGAAGSNQNQNRAGGPGGA